jgi:excisionase family DNA binding protein
VGDIQGVSRSVDATQASDLVDRYRKANLRLRLMLFGDGINTMGLVKGEESRLRVTAELRHLQEVFDAAVLESEEHRGEKTEAPVAGLGEDLHRVASLRSRSQPTRRDPIPGLLTPTETARELGTSVGSIYRAVRDGEIRAVRLTDKKRGALRIPASELERLRERAGSS